MDEEKLRELLNESDKEQLIESFIKLKKINSGLCDRLAKVEARLDELEDINSLIENLPD